MKTCIRKCLILCASLACLCSCSTLERLGNEVLQNTVAEFRTSVAEAVAGPSGEQKQIGTAAPKAATKENDEAGDPQIVRTQR